MRRLLSPTLGWAEGGPATPACCFRLSGGLPGRGAAGGSLSGAALWRPVPRPVCGTQTFAYGRQCLCDSSVSMRRRLTGWYLCGEEERL